MEKDELKKRMSELKKRIMTLEWDKQHNQIHIGHDRQLEEMKKELKEIKKELNPPEPSPDA